MPGVMLGVPRERDIMTEALDSILKVGNSLRNQGLSSDTAYNLHWASGHRVDRNRDNIVEAFMKHPANPEWLMFLDSDMEFAPSIVERLLAADKPLVGGLYFHRGRIHDPLVFKYLGVEEDRYGRQRPTYKAMRDEVFDFLTRNGAPRADGAMFIEEPVGDHLLECDAIGTGAMLINRSILEAMEAPWFEYQGGYESEDLQFCRRVYEEQNIKPWVDMSVVCGHLQAVGMGQAQFRMVHEARGIELSSLTAQQAVELVASFYGIEDSEADARIAGYKVTSLQGEWSKYAYLRLQEDDLNGNLGSVTDFYEKNEVGRLYLLELLYWNGGKTFQGFQHMLKGYRNSTVLEIGSGIGTVAIQLALQGCTVICVEPNDRLRQFAQHHWDWLQPKISGGHGEIMFFHEIGAALNPDLRAGLFDLVVAIDVFEHIYEAELPGLLQRIGNYTKDRGRLFAHNNWGQQDRYPMHFDHSKLFNGWVEAAGFLPLDGLWSCRFNELTRPVETAAAVEVRDDRA